MTLIVDVRHRLGTFRLDVSFRAENGVTALFGRSGSGKTSLIRLIAGLLRPDDGRLTLDEEPLVDTQRRIFLPAHRRRFGCVFQEDRLFPHLTVRRNLRYGGWFAPRAEQAERQAHFDKVVDLLGIGALLERGPAGLSGGERQRVAIGRALLSQPRLLLMDEPLAALDEARKAEILPYLERVCTEMDLPIIYVSHSIVEVSRLADTVVLIDNGTVAACGDAADIFSRPGLSTVAGRRDAGAIIRGVIRQSDPASGLTSIVCNDTILRVPYANLPAGRKVQVHVSAKDVLLSLSEPADISALNILKGTIVRFGPVDDGMIEVQLLCGASPLLARITDFSRKRLNLSEGMAVYAIVKSVAFDPL